MTDKNYQYSLKDRLKSWAKKPLVILFFIVLDSDEVFVDVSPYETYREAVISCKTVEMPFTDHRERFMLSPDCVFLLNPARIHRGQYRAAYSPLKTKR